MARAKILEALGGDEEGPAAADHAIAEILVEAWKRANPENGQTIDRDVLGQSGISRLLNVRAPIVRTIAGNIDRFLGAVEIVGLKKQHAELDRLTDRSVTAEGRRGFTQGFSES